ncbi:MAG TPA: D-alanyl-D-alanine carboxypeptidase [Solirubrobacteraceae bacterium]|nr:D-alanyl-D-alanine carboxypeptidase [Solirubrobacteraceae bacterium]
MSTALWVVFVTAPPAPAATAHTLPGLQAELSRQLTLAGRADGAYVYDVTAKKVLYSLRPTTTRPPASVEKLYTATAVLGRMGATARLATTVLGVGQLTPGGVWEGDIYLRGGGDPTFGSSAFIRRHYGGIGTSVTTLARTLKKLGIHKITGTVDGDESYFDSLRGEPSSDYRPDYFLEGTLSALSFDRGATGSERGAHAPAAYAARQLRKALREVGVAVAGSGTAASAPSDAVQLVEAPSPTISQLLALTLPPSDNFFAETLLKDLGARYGTAGTTAAGAAVASQEISSLLGIHPRIVDGSGLSESDHTSPYQVADLLAQLYGTPIGTTIREHLAVAGLSGTLETRMRRTIAAGHCEGKTGTLTGASNLAGYCQAANGHIVAFVIFNDRISTTSAHVYQDRIVIAIAGSRPSEAELAAIG